MKQQLKDNRGMALTMVLVLLTVMTVLGTSVYAYSMQAIKTLRFGTNRQKAEYLARSGIEASVFMYQDAMLKYDKNADVKTFVDAATDDGDASSDETITTNWVYLLQDGKTFVDGGNGVTPTPPEGKDYIGYYRVTVTNDTRAYQMPAGEGRYVEATEYIKRFTCTAYCGSSAATKKAYIVPLVDITGKGWVSSDGIIKMGDVCRADMQANGIPDPYNPDPKKLPYVMNDDTSLIVANTISIDCGLIDRLVSELSTLFPGYIKGGRIKNQPLYLASVSGNMVISEPANSDTIRYAKDGYDHSDGFISLANLFVESNIDVEPERTHYNALYLRGNEIVVDGEINMYVYDPGTNNANSLFAAVTGIIQKIARNYRFSTVVIGTPSSLATTVADPMPKSVGGLGSCGKVYFGGDVYVNLISRNSTRKYKVFSAGDIYYFNGAFEVNGSAMGIDLLKFFLDTAIEEGNYSNTVLRQFERTRQFYYPDATEQDTYSKEKHGTTPPSMRKVDLEKNGAYDTIVDTVLPSSGDASYIIWE